VTFTARTKGTWGNDIDVQFTLESAGVYTLAVIAPVDNNGTLATVETFRHLVLTPNTHANYIETVINNGTFTVAASEYVTATIVNGALVPVYTVQSLASGNSGLAPIDADYVGSSAVNPPTGLKAFRNPEGYQIHLLATPGESAAAVQTELVACVAARADRCIALLDPLVSQAAADIATWNQLYTSNYSAAYWGWAYYENDYNHGAELLCPPSGYAAYAITKSDMDTAAWYAPSGTKRGVVPFITSLEYAPTQAERDTLMTGVNAVNCLIEVPGVGVCVWGNLTLYKVDGSAFSYLSSRRMISYVETEVLNAVRELVFAPNDPVSWATFVALATPILEAVKNDRGLVRYSVQCDATTQTAGRVLGAKVLIVPMPTAEIVMIDFTVVATGSATYTELVG